MAPASNPHPPAPTSPPTREVGLTWGIVPSFELDPLESPKEIRLEASRGEAAFRVPSLVYEALKFQGRRPETKIIMRQEGGIGRSPFA